MRYEQINSSLFIQNRERLKKLLKPDSVAIFFSNDLMPRGADSFHTFRQNPDIFYMTGVDQEESFLLMFPDAPNPEWKEILFIRETSPLIAVWEGEKLTKEQASEISGVKNVQWAENFEKMLPAIMFHSKNCYLNSNEHARYSSPADYADLRHLRKIKAEFPLMNYERLAPLMHQLRAVKSDIEIELMKHACSITRKGFECILKFVKPGVMEYEVEAELMHEFLRNRSRGHAYEPIIASGKNACVLHYVTNNEECKDGDLMLLDFGCEYANYASDLTRCIPVNGRFSKRQKEVYSAVLRVFYGMQELIRPGRTIRDNQAEAVAMIEKELVDLGLLTNEQIRDQDPANPAYRKYFMHGVSHYLGIDVHDVGNHYRPMEEGMVLTCEPGIYIREEGIGVRIEGDILVNNSGKGIDLLGNVPVEIEEIEDIMNTSRQTAQSRVGVMA